MKISKVMKNTSPLSLLLKQGVAPGVMDPLINQAINCPHSLHLLVSCHQPSLLTFYSQTSLGIYVYKVGMYVQA